MSAIDVGARFRPINRHGTISGGRLPRSRAFTGRPRVRVMPRSVARTRSAMTGFGSGCVLWALEIAARRRFNVATECVFACAARNAATIRGIAGSVPPHARNAARSALYASCVFGDRLARTNSATRSIRFVQLISQTDRVNGPALLSVLMPIARIGQICAINCTLRVVDVEAVRVRPRVEAR